MAYEVSDVLYDLLQLRLPINGNCPVSRKKGNTIEIQAGEGILSILDIRAADVNLISKNAVLKLRYGIEIVQTQRKIITISGAPLGKHKKS